MVVAPGAWNRCNRSVDLAGVRAMWRRWSVPKTVAVVTAMLASMLVAIGPVAVAQSGPVEVGMPFAGQWAYNAPVAPPYSDSNSSHPSVHHTPGAGHWGTDLYGSEGQAVKLHLSHPGGAVSVTRDSSSTTCGQSLRVTVQVNGAAVGQLYFAHLANVPAGAITPGMTIGTVHAWGCNPGRHVHVEFRNNANHACYTDHGSPGRVVGEAVSLGMLGSSNTGPRQACVTAPPVGQPSALPAVTVAVNPNGGHVLFGRGGAGELTHSWQEAPGTSWSAWNSLGGAITGQPVVGVAAGGGHVVAARGAGGDVVHIWQSGPLGPWSSWVSLGGAITGTPAIAPAVAGGNVVFARGVAGDLTHTWQSGPGSGWSAWTSLGGSITSTPVVATAVTGGHVVFARGTGGDVVHTWQTGPGTEWSGWTSLGGPITSDPTVIAGYNGGLVAFARGAAGELTHRWQAAPGTDWYGWTSLGGALGSAPTAHAASVGGGLVVYSRSSSGNATHTWQTTAGGAWSEWTSLNGNLT
nr:hypothetical protein [Actinokineospora terrae]